MRKSIPFVVTLASVLLLAIACAPERETQQVDELPPVSTAPPPPAGTADTAPPAGTAAAAEQEGQQAFMTLGCNNCHGVSTANIQAKADVGPDLAGVSGRREDLAAYIQSDEHPSAWRGSEEQLDTLVDWLRQQ